MACTMAQLSRRLSRQCSTFLLGALKELTNPCNLRCLAPLKDVKALYFMMQAPRERHKNTSMFKYSYGMANNNTNCESNRLASSEQRPST